MRPWHRVARDKDGTVMTDIYTFHSLGLPGVTLARRARDDYLQGRAGMLFYSTFLMDDLVVPGVAADSLTGENFEDLDGADFNPRLMRETEPVGTLTVGGGAAPRRAVGAFTSINGIGLT